MSACRIRLGSGVGASASRAAVAIELPDAYQHIRLVRERPRGERVAPSLRRRELLLLLDLLEQRQRLLRAPPLPEQHGQVAVDPLPVRVAGGKSSRARLTARRIIRSDSSK
jgi:hypothetical protein